MTYNVFGGTLSLNQSVSQLPPCKYWPCLAACKLLSEWVIYEVKNQKCIHTERTGTVGNKCNNNNDVKLVPGTLQIGLLIIIIIRFVTCQVPVSRHRS